MENKPSTSKEIIAYLAEKFPACFSVNGAAKPLKIGIFQDLAEKLAEDDNVSKTRLRQALRHYTSSWRYLKSVKLGAQRVDLDGNEVAEIDQEQADYAAKILKESQEKFAANKAAKAKKVADKAGTQPSEEHATKSRKPVKNKQNFAKVKSSKPNKKSNQPAVELKPLANDAITVGTEVKVQVGNAPMNATVQEISGDDVTVQLASGMVVKTQVKNLFSE
jgi:ProP effector